MKEYELIRTRRKTIAIHIRDGRLFVRAPLRVPLRDIESFIRSKQGWIDKHLAEQRARAEARAGFSLGYGSRVLYLGRQYRIAAEYDSEIPCHSEAELLCHSEAEPKNLRHGLSEPPRRARDDKRQTIYFPPNLDAIRLRKAVILFYKTRAQIYLEARLSHFAPLLGVRPKAMRIGSAKRSWGSCTAAGLVSFSWRLMMAPPEAVDYVVLHELAHLIQLNHSAAFWSLVARLMPDWKERRRALRLLQQRLSHENWE